MSEEKETPMPADADGRLDGHIMFNMVFGHSELKQFDNFENGRMVRYGYRIDYDQHGKETGRTEPSALGSIGCGDGSPFTEIDYYRLST